MTPDALNELIRQTAAELAGHLTDIHRHNRALRKVAKEILKDIWIEARNWHHNEVAAGAGTPAA